MAISKGTPPPPTYKRGTRWWLDARPYKDVGGDREPLCEAGQSLATKDNVRALVLAKRRIKELEELRRAVQLTGIRRALRLHEAAKLWLIHLARETGLDRDTIDAYEWACRWIVTLMPNNPWLHDIATPDGRKLRVATGEAVSRRTHKPLSSSSRRHILKTLEMIVEWGQTEGIVPAGPNPVTAALKKMVVRNQPTPYFEPVEVAAFLQGLVDIVGSLTPLVLVTFIWALTGARRSEGRGVLVGDIDAVRGVVRYKCNRWRKIKGREKSWRAVPLWPLLALAIRAYRPPQPPLRGHLLCTGTSRTGKEIMVEDRRLLFHRAQLRAIAILDEAGIEHSLREHRLTARALRVAYASARVQTTDHGQPVADRTVVFEMGHQSRGMLDKVYARIGRMELRRRLPIVEYRLPDGTLPGEALFREVLGDEEVDLISGIQSHVSGDVLEGLGLVVDPPQWKCSEGG